MWAEAFAVATFVAESIKVDGLSFIPKAFNFYGYIGPIWTNFGTNFTNLIAR